MKPCPECDSENVFKCTKPVSARGGYGPDLLPDLGSFFSAPKLQTVMCLDCGLVRFYASSDLREQVYSSSLWRPV